MLRQYFAEQFMEAGCDEAGRGCLAGPVFAAAVILPPDYCNSQLNDSKQLTCRQRETLRRDIEKNAVAAAVAAVDNNEIDKINILNASIAAMHKALDLLPQQPLFIIVDSNKFKPYRNVPHRCIVKGDALYMSIAAASILAKTYRDDLMIHLNNEYPQYLWAKNKGYPTKEHRLAIRKYGLTPYHRRSFKLLDNQLEFDF